MTISEFAVSGAPPTFQKDIPVGQLYFPEWERYEAATRGIFERRYYTNHGPLITELEHQLQEMLNVKHVICVVNATVGLMMAADALQLKGKVIMPSFTFVASAQAMRWAGLEPLFCDVDVNSHQIDPAHVARLINHDVSAIMGVNLWGGATDITLLQDLAAQHNIALFFDSAHAFGCEVSGKKVGSFGDLEVISFHATKMLSATEGGCVCTNDDKIAARLRNIRSSYGSGPVATVVRTSNGRMSEFQAAIALLNLEDFEKNRANNQAIYSEYSRYLADIPGLKLYEPKGVSRSNYQYIVCELDEVQFGLSREQLIKVLKAENINARKYFYPGVHQTIGFISESQAQDQFLPITEILCERCFQLPVGAMITMSDVKKITDIIHRAHKEHVALLDVL